MKHSKILLLSLCLWFSNSAFALRCGEELVALGDSKEDVIEKCGDPESAETHIERKIGSNFASGSQYRQGAGFNYGQQQYVEIEVIVEEWVYDFGRRRFKQYLRFENGRLKEIQTLNRHGD